MLARGNKRAVRLGTEAIAIPGLGKSIACGGGPSFQLSLGRQCGIMTDSLP
jgi:hypothetical protein